MREQDMISSEMKIKIQKQDKTVKAINKTKVDIDRAQINNRKQRAFAQ